MPPLGPITRIELIRCLRQLGFAGPYAGGKHQFMVQGTLRVRLPNPHQGDINSVRLNFCVAVELSASSGQYARPIPLLWPSH